MRHPEERSGGAANLRHLPESIPAMLDAANPVERANAGQLRKIFTAQGWYTLT